MKILKHEEIFYHGRCVMVCDQKCNKAWGINNRPRNQLSDDPDDFEWFTDDELGEAPIDPGTYECDHAKPLTPEQGYNKWCARECERSKTVSPYTFGTRMKNQP
jgi:hypothetical protein